MYIWLILALIFAALEAAAVSRNLQRLEYIAKPAVMVFLFLWLYASTGLRGDALWFGLGIGFSLVGDVLLMFSSESFFLLGLIAFLFAHLSYIMGFREALGTINTWSLILAIVIAINTSRLLQRIIRAMRGKGEHRMVAPVILYGAVISLMLYSAMSTIYDPTWKTSATLFVSLGALFFCASDVILAWNKFVSSVRNGGVSNILLYYLGQIGLVAGIISQLG